MGFLVRVLVNAVTIALAAALVPGIELHGAWPALLAGLVLGLVNALVRPVLVLNGICLALTAWVVPGLDIAGLLPATLGALVISVVSWALTAFVNDRGRLERYR